MIKRVLSRLIKFFASARRYFHHQQMEGGNGMQRISSKTKALTLFWAVLGIFLLSGCGDDANRSSLSLTYTDPPIELNEIQADFAKEVAYGGSPEHTFDIYLPESDEPTPLVIYIHGGGFTGGDKNAAHERRAADIREFLEEGIAYATINYRLLSEDPIDEEGVIKSLTDCARALQFIRYHAEMLNVDPENVALYGSSAGAGTSLWLGVHDDLADSGNDDPVLRESTRVNAVAALATQATYDVLRWEEVLLPVLEPYEAFLGGTDIPTVATTIGAEDYLLSFLGIPGLDALESPETAAYRANVDMLALMDAEDAPVFVHNFTVSFDDILDAFLHHGLHARAVKERADAVGLACVAYIDDPDCLLEDPSGEELVDFLLRHL
jgi:para-nitrobenzyl esterase